MSENIQSISQGTYTIGQTSATNFVAGPGISIDQPSEGVVRIGNDETVLYTSSDGTNSDVDFSETRNNFEYIRIIYRQNDGHNECKDVYNIYNNNNLTLNSFTLFQNFIINKVSKYTFKNDGTGITFVDGGELTSNGWSSGGRIYILKVIGINRISGSNA